MKRCLLFVTCLISFFLFFLFGNRTSKPFLIAIENLLNFVFPRSKLRFSWKWYIISSRTWGCIDFKLFFRTANGLFFWLFLWNKVFFSWMMNFFLLIDFRFIVVFKKKGFSRIKSFFSSTNLWYWSFKYSCLINFWVYFLNYFIFLWVYNFDIILLKLWL